MSPLVSIIYVVGTLLFGGLLIASMVFVSRNQGENEEY
jgi:hypothetical protein